MLSHLNAFIGWFHSPVCLKMFLIQCLTKTLQGPLSRKHMPGFWCPFQYLEEAFVSGWLCLIVQRDTLGNPNMYWNSCRAHTSRIWETWQCQRVSYRNCDRPIVTTALPTADACYAQREHWTHVWLVNTSWPRYIALFDSDLVTICNIL